jgi:hypothetical protein
MSNKKTAANLSTAVPASPAPATPRGIPHDRFARGIVAVVAIKAARITDPDAVPAHVRADLVGAGFVVDRSKAGRLSIKRGSARIAPSQAVGVLAGFVIGDPRGVGGWHTPATRDGSGAPVPVLTLLDAVRAGERIVLLDE